MLAYCLVDGLTCNRKVYKNGDIFILPISMEAAFGDMTISQLASKQKQTYGRELFRFPVPDELTEAYRQNKIVLDWCSSKEKALIKQDLEEKKRKLGDAADAIGRIIEEPVEEKESEPAAFESKGAKVKISTVKPKATKPKVTKPKATKSRSVTRKSPSKQKAKKE